MSATPTIRSSQPPPVARDLAALHAAVERLFEAPDAAGVMEVCELMLDNFGIRGRLRWRRMDEQPAPLAGQITLAEDPQWGRPIAARIYAKTRASYHPVTTRDLDKLGL